MTEESQQPVSTVATPTTTPISPDTQNADVIKPKSDNKKEKCKPMTKVVIRRLPPSMTQAQFVEQVSPLPDHDYLHFVKADMSLGPHAFCRAYVNFTEQKDIFIFREKFDNYVFVDGKGTEFPAVVEFAPFQRLPKKRIGRKKDVKCGSIETDPYYVSFLESLKSLEAEAAVQPKTEFSFQPFDNTQKRMTTTPLLEYLKQRKMEKQRARDEKREERRRRDLERRRAKEEPTISKVLKNPDAEREVIRENKENKEEKERNQKDGKTRKQQKEEKSREKATGPRDRDGKPSGKGSKDDRKQEGKHQKKNEDKKAFNRREERENHTKEESSRKSEKVPKEREERERRGEERKGKSYEKMRQEKRRLAESKKQAEVGGGKKEEEKCGKEGKIEKIEKKTRSEKMEKTTSVSAAGDAGGGSKGEVEVQENERSPKKKEGADEDNSTEPPEASSPLKESHLVVDENYPKKSAKLGRRRSSLESGGEPGGSDGALLRRHKSLDGDDQGHLQKNSGDDKHKEKKDARKERRIRNKDRPAMEIYRPGMGRISKQKLERGKSTEERASLSQSPTNTDQKPEKSEKSEVRSMTFKRSVSRDSP